MPLLIVLLAVFCGGAFGSFAGVVVARGWAASRSGRSHCDSCGRTLTWYELVPLISFVAQLGRCRRCGASIGWKTYLFEVGGSIIGGVITLTVLLIVGRTGG